MLVLVVELCYDHCADASSSFFVGDASAVSHKVGDSDKKFAEAVGLDYRDVHEEFG